MNTYKFSLGMDVRAYGYVAIDAESPNQAAAQLTAEYVSQHFEPMGNGVDDIDYSSPISICVLDGNWCEDEDGNQHPFSGNGDGSVPDGPWKQKPEYPEYTKTIYLMASEGKDGTQAHAFNSDKERTDFIWDEFVKPYSDDGESPTIAQLRKQYDDDWSQAKDNGHWPDLLTVALDETQIFAPPDHTITLRTAAGALGACLEQISQMEGMFSDEDGTIAAAVYSGETSLEEISKAITQSPIIMSVEDAFAMLDEETDKVHRRLTANIIEPQKAKLDAAMDLLSDSLSRWENEKPSVQDENAGHIAQLRDFIETNQKGTVS